MPVFRVRGGTRRCEAFTVRFDAPDARAVEAWLAAEGAAIDSLQRLPLSAWPFARFMVMILAFPFLAAERRRQAVRLAVAIALLGWMIWNLLIRTGGHFVLSPRDPRLVLITRGESPFVEGEAAARA